MVAQGATGAQIADHLLMTVRTVGSHLDRIRDKTGCRTRADLTFLAPDRRPGLGNQPGGCPPKPSYRELEPG
jgi:DNA-binding CsgD family transcriptional regulator